MTERTAADLRSLDESLVALEPLAALYPSLDAAQIEIARLKADLTLPKPTVHVLSDVHGEYGKLRHVINNASGTLRPLVEAMFRDRMSAEDLSQFVTLIFYPREVLERVEPTLTDPSRRREFSRRVLPSLLEVVRALARPDRLRRAGDAVPRPYRDLILFLIESPYDASDPSYFDAIIDALADQGRALHLIHLTVRTLRNLAIDELVVAGDFWDRGPRGDRVMDYLVRQPNVAITWGNHDAAWLGACLGHEALIAHVLRISCRYRRLSQLEEGYGVTLQPLERLARDCYGDDPASCYQVKGGGLREPSVMARMQKAAAIVQFKLEGQMIARNPHWGLENRRLLHRINLDAGTVTIDGVEHALRDRHFPTIDPGDPYTLSPEEQTFIDRTRRSFVESAKLWSHMRFMVGRGSMFLVRDSHLIFHACVPVDGDGKYLPLEIGGRPYAGRALFEAIDRAVVGVMDRPAVETLDLLWYLWCGPRSPLFGKDRIATLEIDLVADKTTHAETKNPYFQLIHEVDFCEKILREFGVDPARGLIVNGHVPVKIEAGEDPVKRSGKAITIDGAFSAAYGDHGYTLVLEPDRTFLAEHHHFESVEAAVRDGVDIVPRVRTVREWSPPRRVADTEGGDAIAARIDRLEELVTAYGDNRLRQAAPPEPTV